MPLRTAGGSPGTRAARAARAVPAATPKKP